MSAASFSKLDKSSFRKHPWATTENGAHVAQLFSPAMNLAARVAIVGAPIVALLGGVAVAYWAAWSDWVTSRFVFREQTGPGENLPFSHEHHVGGLGIDCRYCHAGLEVSPVASVPPTQVCITCHSQMWIHAPMLEPVRQSWADLIPIAWTRVHDLPDYVYFDHSIHVAKGVGCSTCHGNVAEMPLMTRVVNLQIRWCLDCHSAPEKHLRPIEEIYNTSWQEPEDQLARGKVLLEKYHVQKEQLTNCSVCHR